MLLKKDLIDPQLGAGDGLEVVPIHQASEPWAQLPTTVLRCWVVQPTRAFIKEQQNMVLGLTLAYFGLTILALITILVAMWFLVRVARRNVALAELKSNFAADVSHELKTPLALIRLFGETLQSGRVVSEQKRQEYYSIITRESSRLATLINNILDFARIEAGRKEYKLQPTDVGQVVRETYNAYRAELDHDGFEHALTVADELPPIDADAGAISQVLVNLIGNAVKYSGTERFLGIEVTCDTRRGRRGVLITVHDRGIGISPEDRAHLFDGFFRASDDRVRDKGGAGLGLALVKRIVDAHHGSVEVESRLVKGTTFRIFLPTSGRPEAKEGDVTGRRSRAN
jgi:signal transduction histidine kinase